MTRLLVGYVLVSALCMVVLFWQELRLGCLFLGHAWRRVAPYAVECERCGELRSWEVS